jgi:hypothetical protein
VDAWRLFALLGSEGERDALFLQGGEQDGDDGLLHIFIFLFVIVFTF